MGVDVTVNDVAISRLVSGYSADEEATPIDPSDTTGATARFTLDFVKRVSAAEVKRMRRKSIELQDGSQGTTRGLAVVPSSSKGLISLSADARTNLLNAERTARPFVGVLGNYLTYLLSLVGITNGYVIDDSIANRQVTYRGWQNDVYLMMKQVLVAQSIEMTYVSNNIVFRPLRSRIAVTKRDSDISWSLDETGLARSVEAWLYNSQYRASSLAYPIGGWTPDVQVYQVEARERLEFDIPIEASLFSVQQPVPVDFVDRYHSSSSVYSVTGNDDLPLPAQQWRDTGGSVTVEVGEDTRSLKVVIQGPNLDRYSPYRIAVSAGPSDSYSSLRIVGTGVFYEGRTLLKFGTTIGPDLASVEVGATIDNAYIATLSQLYDRIIWSLKRYGGSRQTLSVRTVGINRLDDNGSYAYPIIKDFNTVNAGKTIAQFNAANSGKTIAQFNSDQAATVRTAFANQAFGNVAGARREADDLMWRIRTARISPGEVSYTAEEDTTVGDLNTKWSGGTVAEFNAYWAGKTLGDYNMGALALPEVSTARSILLDSDGVPYYRLQRGGAVKLDTDGVPYFNTDSGEIRFDTDGVPYAYFPPSRAVPSLNLAPSLSLAPSA